MKQSQLFISYENLKYVNGGVHDTIVARLREVAEIEEDPRRAQAFFELAVIVLSDYAGPLSTPKEGLAMLRKSAELGDVRAQGMLFRVQKALKLHEEVSPQIREWLEKAVQLGHRVAMADLRALHNLP